MKIDPHLVAMNEQYHEAIRLYDEHIKQFAHPVQWPLLSQKEKNAWVTRVSTMK